MSSSSAMTMDEFREVMTADLRNQNLSKDELIKLVVDSALEKRTKMSDFKEQTDTTSAIALSRDADFEWDESESDYFNNMVVFNIAFPAYKTSTSCEFMSWTNAVRNQQYSNFKFNLKLNVRIARLATNSFVICLRRKMENKNIYFPYGVFTIIMSFVSFREIFVILDKSD